MPMASKIVSCRQKKTKAKSISAGFSSTDSLGPHLHRLFLELARLRFERSLDLAQDDKQRKNMRKSLDKVILPPRCGFPPKSRASRSEISSLDNAPGIFARR